MNVLRKLRKHYKNPPFTPLEFVLDLTAKSMPKLAAQVRSRRQFLWSLRISITLGPHR